MVGEDDDDDHHHGNDVYTCVINCKGDHVLWNSYTPYIFDNQLHHERWKFSLYSERCGFTPTANLRLPFQQQHHCPLSVETSVILWQFMRPFEPTRYWTDFDVSGLHPGRSIRTWKHVKESMWMNKWCRPSVKDGTGKRWLFKNASFLSASAPLKSVLRKYCSIAINKIK